MNLPHNLTAESGPTFLLSQNMQGVFNLVKLVHDEVPPAVLFGELLAVIMDVVVIVLRYVGVSLVPLLLLYFLDARVVASGGGG